MNDNTEISQRSSALQFFRHPAVGVTGTIASVIGFVLSIYFFQASREKPKLTYFINPAKAAVVRTGRSSSLSVKLAGQELTGDITAAQIAFWNAGKKSIRSNSVLSPLVIRTSNKERILEASLRKTSRDIVGITLDSSRLESGAVEVRWNILEQNDGGVIQIVYAGDEKVNIDAQAVIETQPEIGYLKNTPRTTNINLFVIIMAFTFAGMGFSTSAILSMNRITEWYINRPGFLGWILVQILVIIVSIIGMGVLIRNPGPPFGF